jgi:hypothetical protein
MNLSFRKKKNVNDIKDKNPNDSNKNNLIFNKEENKGKSNLNKKFEESKKTLKEISLKLENDFSRKKKSNFMAYSSNNNINTNCSSLNQNHFTDNKKTNKRQFMLKSREKEVAKNFNKKKKNSSYNTSFYKSRNKSPLKIQNQKKFFPNYNILKLINKKNSLTKNNRNNYINTFNKSKSMFTNNSQNNINIDINSERKNNNNNIYRVFSFKETKEFIKGFNNYYNKIKVKPRFLLKNISSFLSNKYSLDYKSNEFDRNKRIFSSYDINRLNPKKKIKSFKYGNHNNSINRILDIIKNQINKSKQKDNKNITFRQVLRDSDFYSYDLL